MDAIIQVMESTMGARDPYTVGHQQRVTQIASAIAERMGLSRERIRELRVACSLHDLGKIAVPAEILSKPGKLTELEFAMIKSHPQVAYDILKPLNFPGQISQIMLQHHERMDGSGYPFGLKGKEILLEARILGVADVVEAMCSHRPYRPSLGIEQALEEISRNRGTLYDPGVVDNCLGLYQEAPEIFRGKHSRDGFMFLPVKNSDNRVQMLKWQKKVTHLNWQSLFNDQTRFFLHAATASVMGCLIVLGRGF